MVQAIEKLIGSSYMLGLIHAEEENPEHKINAADETEIPEIPFNEAMQFLKSKVPMSKSEWLELEPKLRFRAFTVAQLGSAELVDKAKQILLKSFEKGGGTYSDTWEELKKKVNVNALGIKLGYWENVFRTNTQSAYIAGKLQQYENTNVAAYQLMVIEDGRTSKICRHLLTASGYGMVISVDHPFWKKYGFPPYHFQCRTSIRAIWPSQVGKLGNMVENPTMKSLSKFKVQEGFGGNPLERGNWWEMTDSMKRLAEKFGLKQYFQSAEKIIIDKASKSENIKTILDKIEQLNKTDKQLKDDVKELFKNQPFYKEFMPLQKEGFLKRVDSFNHEQLNLLKNYLGDIEILYDQSIKESYYNGVSIVLKNINDLYHEFGHFLDDVILENMRARDYLTNFLEVVRKDALVWINKNSNGVTITSLDKIPRATRDLLNDKMRVRFGFNKYGDVSDVMDGLTNGKIGGYDKCNAGHSKGYYDFNDTVKHIEGESIAIITDAWYNPYSDESEGFKEVFPNAYDMYIDFLRGQVNVL